MTSCHFGPGSTGQGSPVVRCSAMHAPSLDDSRYRWERARYLYANSYAIRVCWERFVTRIVGITTVRGLAVYAGCTSIVQIADTNLHAQWKERLRRMLQEEEVSMPLVQWAELTSMATV